MAPTSQDATAHPDDDVQPGTDVSNDAGAETEAVDGEIVEEAATLAPDRAASAIGEHADSTEADTDADADIVDAEVVPTPAGSWVPSTPAPAFDYTDAGVPTLNYVQDKIERRYANALGGTELAEATPEAHSAADAQAEREKAAADRLEEIRRSLRSDP